MENRTTALNLSGGNGSDYKDELTKSLNIMFITINILVFVLGVLGNGVVIWVTGFKTMKTVITVWYLNLAVADFLFTAFLPLTITHIALDDHWPFGKFMSEINFSVLSINMYASVYILMAISVDRCVCVVWPVWAKIHRSVRKASCVSLGVWVLALALSSPYFFYMDTRPSLHDKDIIWCLPRYALPSQLAAMIFTRFLMGFVVPFTVIVSCYSVIIYRLRRNRLRRNRSLARHSGRPFKIIAAVVTAFFLCWVPFHIMEQIALWGIIMVAEHSETLDHVITVGVPIATSLAFLNSCLNPMLYMFMGRDFKDEARKLSILKVLENAFTEDPQTNSSTKSGFTFQEIALSEAQV